MRKLIQGILLLIIGSLVALILSEFLLRTFWNPPYLDERYRRDDLAWMKKNVILNSFGYRDKQIDPIKGDIFRIYSLGDSYTFGWYIDDGNTAYPKVWEKKLKSRFGQNRVEVINAAQPGFNLEEEYHRYLNEGVLFAPDVVSIGINIYDLAGREFPPGIKNNIFSNSRLYELVINNPIRKKASQDTEAEVLNSIKEGSKQLIKAKENLQKLNNEVAKDGGKLLLIIFPNYNPNNPNSRYLFTNFHKQIKKIGQELNIEVIDLLKPFQLIDDKTALVLNPTDPHPSEKANEIAGDYIFKNSSMSSSNLDKKRYQNFKELTLSQKRQFDNLRSIFAINPPENWVFFNRQFGLSTYKLFIKNTKDKKTNYMFDYIKTAQALTHNGWPGAQIEYNYPAQNNKIEISTNLYEYPVIGIHQVTGFFREKGSLKSTNFNFSDLAITRDNEKINIEIRSSTNLDFFRIIVDIAVKQFDFENNQIVSFSQTDFIRKTFDNYMSEFEIELKEEEDINLSFPVFVSNESSMNYSWANNELVKVQLKKEGKKLKAKFNSPKKGNIEIPYSTPRKYNTDTLPTIIYL